MKFATSLREAVLGLLLLALLIAVACVVVDERLSRQLSENDPTWEEQMDFPPGAYKAMNDRRLP